MPLLQGPKPTFGVGTFGSFCYIFICVSGAPGILGVNLIEWVLLMDPYLIASRGPKTTFSGFLLYICSCKWGPWYLGAAVVVWVLLPGPCL